MKTTLLQVIASDKKQDGTPYINRNGQPFQMLHIQLPDGSRASKYYPNGVEVPNIEANIEYDIEIVENGGYHNIKSLQTVVTVEQFKEAARQYGFGLDEELTRKMDDYLQQCYTIEEAVAVVRDYMEEGALEHIRLECGSVRYI